MGKIIDRLYILLAVFTYLYMTATAFAFFSRGGANFPVLAQILDALAEPYLGSVGIYVILKEIRKRRFAEKSKHSGEIFVLLWLLLLFVSTAFVVFSPVYAFDEVAGLIVTMGLAVVVIYIGGLIHRP